MIMKKKKKKEIYNGTSIEVENGKDKYNMNKIYDKNKQNLNTVICTEQQKENQTETEKPQNYEKYFIPIIEDVENEIEGTDEQKIKIEKKFFRKDKIYII